VILDVNRFRNYLVTGRCIAPEMERDKVICGYPNSTMAKLFEMEWQKKERYIVAETWLKATQRSD
jgi:hypothetical protein